MSYGCSRVIILLISRLSFVLLQETDASLELRSKKVHKMEKIKSQYFINVLISAVTVDEVLEAVFEYLLVIQMSKEFLNVRRCRHSYHLGSFRFLHAKIS
jgi:hypothetical protein